MDDSLDNPVNPAEMETPQAQDAQPQDAQPQEVQSPERKVKPKNSDAKLSDDQKDHLKGAIETLLFVNEKPVTIEQLKDALETVNITEVKVLIHELQEAYEARSGGMKLKEIAGGYQMLSNPAYAPYVRNFYKTKHKEKLSKPALECLAIVAYKQPVTRADIELIRGVNSDGVVAHLLDKELIKVVGRKDIAGRPFMYGATKQFLEYFGLKSFEDLPKLEEFPALAENHVQATAVEGESAEPTETAQTETQAPASPESTENTNAESGSQNLAEDKV